MRWLCLLVFFSVRVLFAQDRNGSAETVQMTPDGPLILFNMERSSVHRVTTTDKKQPSVVVRAAPNWEAFKLVAGSDVISALKTTLRIGDESALWKHIQSHTRMDSYGLLAMNPGFLRAMGAAFLDRRPHRYGYKITYKIEALDEAGRVTETASRIFSIPAAPFYSPPRIVEARTDDSLVYMRWAGKLTDKEAPLARVFRQSGGVGSFERTGGLIMPEVRNDSVYFSWAEKVPLNSLYRYYLKLQDAWGNASQSTSDTANVITRRFSVTDKMSNTGIRDSSGGLYLTWNEIPFNPAFTGLQIQRSRNINGDYLILDTIATDQTAYFDRRLLPGVVYYYRIRPLLLGNSGGEFVFSAYLNGSVKNRGRLPDAPYNVRVVQAGPEEATLKWNGATEIDVYGYDIFRGTYSDPDSAMLIASGIKVNQFADKSADRDIRSTYYYFVRTINSSGAQSSFSEPAIVRSGSGKMPEAPGGVSARLNGVQVRLEWEDVRVRDHTVAGYIVYKRILNKQQVSVKSQNTASEEAKLVGLSPIPLLLKQPVMMDPDVVGGNTYLYSVSTLDAFGNESVLASPATVSVLKREVPEPILGKAVKSASGIELNWQVAANGSSTGFYVFRRLLSRPAYTKIGTLKGTVLSFTDKTAKVGEQYVYTIVNVTSDGESKMSNAESGVR